MPLLQLRPITAEVNQLYRLDSFNTQVMSCLPNGWLLRLAPQSESTSKIGSRISVAKFRFFAGVVLNQPSLWCGDFYLNKTRAFTQGNVSLKG